MFTKLEERCYATQYEITTPYKMQTISGKLKLHNAIKF